MVAEARGERGKVIAVVLKSGRAMAGGGGYYGTIGSAECLSLVVRSMKNTTLSGGVVHKMTPDLRKALQADKAALQKWESLTPLARNEWICWVTFVQKAETRQDHVRRVVSELKDGQRRPCCWLGCIHRKDKVISRSVKGILSKRGYKV